MAQNYYNEQHSLLYKNISYHADEIRSYINNRRKRIAKSLATKWYKFNNLCMGGIEPNSVYTFTGITGSGKSSFIGSLESDLFELNKDIDFVVLNFAFEMLPSKVVGRKLSYKLKKTTSELYSGGDKTLSDNDFENVNDEINKIKTLPIYYVDVPGTVEQIRKTIIDFSQNEGKDKWIIIILDHTLLTKGLSGENERTTLSNLQRMFIEMKKYGRNTIIQLSQMNRNIESVDRITNKSMHFPTRGDIFGSDAIMQGSDYVFVIHRPQILGIPDGEYGPRNYPTDNLIYLHCIKNREGELGILLFENDLKHNRLEETTLDKQLNKENETSAKISFSF